MHVQCNEAQCSQGPESISKCLNTYLTILLFSFTSSLTISLCSKHSSLRILTVHVFVNLGLFCKLEKKTVSTMLM